MAKSRAAIAVAKANYKAKLTKKYYEFNPDNESDLCTLNRLQDITNYLKKQDPTMTDKEIFNTLVSIAHNEIRPT